MNEILGSSHQIAAAYDGLLLEPERLSVAVRQAWAELAEDSVERAAGVRLLLDVRETTEPEPYVSAVAMCDDIHGGRFYVSTANCEHPLWTPAENVAFRIVHDVLGHYAASVAAGFPDWTRGEGDELRPPSASVAGFDWPGEVAACGAHAPLLDPVGRAALFTECLGQTAYAVERGGFPAQRVGFLERHLPAGERRMYYRFLTQGVTA